MFGLLVTTIFTSAADSLNPVAITQQFVLQGMVKKAKHIWFFILATAVTNFIGGIMAYYGLATVISNTATMILKQFGSSIYIIEFIAGVILLMFAFYFVLSQKIKQFTNSNNTSNEEEDEKRQISMKIKSVSPFSLTILGIIATIAELTTALPYFAFLAILLNYQLNFISVLLILLIYNFIYSSPLMVLYFIYRKKQELFERFYLFSKEKMKKMSAVLVPFATGLIGVLIIFHSLSLLVI